MIAAKDTGESSEKNNVDKIDHGLKGKDTNSKPELSKEEVKIASQYVKDLVND
ncbi:MAG: hypothetical protein LRY71_07505 [Bacillaceae bacterium]|nr:hypothetical protein [Bacillaceae bacterium]